VVVELRGVTDVPARLRVTSPVALGSAAAVPRGSGAVAAASTVEIVSTLGTRTFTVG